MSRQGSAAPVFPMTPAQWAAIPLDDREERGDRRFTYLYRMHPLPGGGYREVAELVEVDLVARIPLRIARVCSACGVAGQFVIEGLSELVCDVCGARGADVPSVDDRPLPF